MITGPSDPLELGLFSEGVVTVNVKIPCTYSGQSTGLLAAMYSIQEQAGSLPTIDVEGYIEGELVGGIEIQMTGDGKYNVFLPAMMKLFP